MNITLAFVIINTLFAPQLTIAIPLTRLDPTITTATILLDVSTLYVNALVNVVYGISYGVVSGFLISSKSRGYAIECQERTACKTACAMDSFPVSSCETDDDMVRSICSSKLVKTTPQCGEICTWSTTYVGEFWGNSYVHFHTDPHVNFYSE